MSATRPNWWWVRNEAKVLKFDQEKAVLLGVKQLSEDPCWPVASLPAGTRLFGKVTNLTDYGAFVEVEDGIEGLVRVRNGLDQQNVDPKVVTLKRSRSWFWTSTKIVAVFRWA